jgi:hypothetical protein
MLCADSLGRLVVKPSAPLLAAVLLIAASAAHAQQAAVTPQHFRLAEDGACAGEIARYREIVDSDGATGNVAKRVYNQIKSEVAAAERECSAGHDAQARALVLASKKRHGYPTGLCANAWVRNARVNSCIRGSRSPTPRTMCIRASSGLVSSARNR